jgi:monovalent cation/hydrogen antiporter
VIEKATTFSLRELAIAIAVVTAIAIVARFIWVFPATYLPRWLSPSLRKRDPSPPWTYTFVIAFTGVRGVVSLAAALAIPLTLASGAPFPNRDLILFITFGVILLTLVGLGLTLPLVIRWLKLGHDRETEEEQEYARELVARHEAMEAALRQIEEDAEARGLSDDALALARARHEIRSKQFPKSMDEGWDAAALAARVRMDLITAEREYIYQLLRDGKINDETRRKIERELDLEEALIACKEDEK